MKKREKPPMSETDQSEKKIDHQKIPTLSIIDGLLFLLLLLFYRGTIAWIIATYFDIAFYEYGIAFLLLMGVAVAWCIKNRKNLKHYTVGTPYAPKAPLAGLIIVFLIDLINTYFLHFSIVSACCFFLSLYCFFGLYLQKKIWKRGVFLVLIMSLTLPFMDHINTFVGFPMRIVTAKVTSFLMQFMGQRSIVESTVIMTENNATSIDLPCSGVKSMYIGTIFMLMIYYFKKVKISWQLFVVTIVFFFTIFFFNTWRVFSLVYVYDVLGMTTYGDTIHVGLGMIGFVFSCYVIWYLSEKFLPKEKSSNKEGTSPMEASLETIASTSETQWKKRKIIVGTTLLVFLVLNEIAIFFLQQQKKETYQSVEQTFNFAMPSYHLEEVPLSDKEQGFFKNREVEFSKKYIGTTQNGLQFSLLLVRSSSWRTHHNPEICLQGMGYSLGESKIFHSNDINLKKITLNDGKATVLYWFYNQEKTLNDYSQRVWEGILHPGKSWTLVEVGFNQPVNVENVEVAKLIQAVQEGLEVMK